MKDLGKTNSITTELSSPSADTASAFQTTTRKSTASPITSPQSDLESLTLASDLKAASVAASFNLSLGSSGSLFTTSSGNSAGASNGTTCGNIYCPTHLSPRQSPKQDIEVIEIFSNELNQLTAAQQVSIVHQSAKESSKKSVSRLTIHPNGRDCNGDDQTSVRFMDKHLSDLEHEQLTDTTCDIAAYMANLKEKTLESQDMQLDSQEQQQNDSSLSPEPQTVVEVTQTVIAEIASPPRPATDRESDSTGTGTGTSEKSEDDSEGVVAVKAAHHVVIDKKVDKVFKSKSSEKPQKSSSGSSSSTCSGMSKTSKGTKSPRQSIYISPDRSKSQGSSPVRIIKVKSPRTSISDQGSKRLSVSRDSSQDRLSSGRRTPSPRRASEGGGGILKRTSSPAPGILKPPQSPCKARSPDRSCLKKLTPSHDCSIESLSPHLSPRNSVEHLSPDRAGASCYRHSPRSSFDSRCSEPNLDIPRSVLKSPRGSFESRSPDRYGVINRKRSMSAHGSFETGQRPAAEPYYHYYPIYDNQTCSDHYVAAAPTTSMRHESAGPPIVHQTSSSSSNNRRLSKSLERSTSRESTTSSSYRYGVSPERIYTINNMSGFGAGPIRSQSAENAFARYGYDPMSGQHVHQPQHHSYQHEPQCPHDSSRSNSSYVPLSSSAPEHNTCIDCLYQKRPS